MDLVTCVWKKLWDCDWVNSFGSVRCLKSAGFWAVIRVIRRAVKWVFEQLQQDTLSCLEKSWIRKRTPVRKYDPAWVTWYRWYHGVGILDSWARWVPLLVPVWTPDPMGSSTKSDLYTYIGTHTYIHYQEAQEARLQWLFVLLIFCADRFFPPLLLNMSRSH